MIYSTVLIDGKQKQVSINQKHICSFQEIEIELNNKITKATELRMSNGDVWIVITPDYTSWIPDAFISGNEY
jgi:hypothetical protein